MGALRRQWHAIPLEIAIAELGSDPARGLSTAEVERRLAFYGPNRIAQAPVASALTIFGRQFASLVIWVLILAAIASALIGERVDAVAILAIVVLDAVVGFFQEHRAERAIAELQRMTAPSARAIRDGRAVTAAASTLVPGDVLLIDAGDLIGADARVIEESGLETNEAVLTGESLPVAKSAGMCAPDAPLAERENMLFLGTAVTRGSGRALVVATAMATEFGNIARLLEGASSERTPLQRQLERVARRLLWFCSAIVALIFTLGAFRGVPVADLFLGAVSLAVAAIPEGLPAVVTVALALGVSRMARRKVLIRRLHSIETLGCAQVICTDKTGTLTLGEMTARRVITAQCALEVTGEGYAGDGSIVIDGHALKDRDPALDALLDAAVVCNDAHLGVHGARAAVVGDPTEGALLVLAAKAGIDREHPRATRVHTFPFTSERKLMTVVAKSGEEFTAFTKGAPEVVLARCSRIRLDAGSVPLEPQSRARIIAENARMASEAMRVIACARRALGSAPVLAEGASAEQAVENELEFLGLIGMQDSPRPEAREAVRKCQLAGIRTVMITGDHPATAAAIARTLGILRPGDEILTGAELDRIEDRELDLRVSTVSVYARVSADHKLRIVRAWKSRGMVVAMTGDGVNDAPALKEAEIGIAMGITGTEVTKQAADVVIADDNFATIVAAVEEGRGIYDNVVKTLIYLMAGNFAELMVMLAAGILGLPLPLLPIQLLWINLVSDALPALALATDPIDSDVLQRTPRDPKAEIITRGFMGWVVVAGTLSATVTLLAFGYGLYRGMGLSRARNAAFFVLVVEEIVRALAARSVDKPLWKIGIASNLRLLLVVIATFALQLLISATPVLEQVFQTRRVSALECAVGIALALIPVSTLEFIKVVRARGRVKRAPRVQEVVSGSVNGPLRR